MMVMAAMMVVGGRVGEGEGKEGKGEGKEGKGVGWEENDVYGDPVALQ